MTTPVALPEFGEYNEQVAQIMSQIQPPADPPSSRDLSATNHLVAKVMDAHSMRFFFFFCFFWDLAESVLLQRPCRCQTKLWSKLKNIKTNFMQGGGVSSFIGQTLEYWMLKLWFMKL